MATLIVRLLRVLPLNPIVVRIVQGGSRRTRHLLIRSAYLAIMVLILLFALLGSGSTLRELAQRGSGAFEIVSTGQVFLICVLAPVFMGGAIAQESNPQTWDVLLTSPLSSLQIVLGNLFGRLFFVLALLVSTFPLFAVTQLFGGVPGSAVIESYAISAASALLMGSIAITLSVTRIAGRRSVFVFYSCIVLFLFVTGAIDWSLRERVAVGSEATFTTVMTPLNPFLTLRVLLGSNTYVPHDFAGTGHFWLVRAWLGSPVATQLWLFSILSVVCIGYSTLRVRLLGGALIGPDKRASGSVQRAPKHVGHNPIAWRERHLRGQSPTLRLVRWLFISLALATALGILLLARAGTLDLAQARIAIGAMVGGEVLVVVLAALNMSATAVSREREDKSLDILLTTPIQPGPYIAGKLWGLVQYLLPLIAVPCATLGLAAIYVVTKAFGGSAPVQLVESVGTTQMSVPMVLPEAAIALPIVLCSFVALCVMIGLQWSVKSKGTIGSVFVATGVVLAIAGSLGLCGYSVGGSIPYVGAAMNMANPMNLVLCAVNPAGLIGASLESPMARRVSLLVGATVVAIGYGAVVYGLHSAMKANFMMTVRRLAGTS